MAGLILLSFHGGHNEEHKEELDRRKGMLRSIEDRMRVGKLAAVVS